MKTAEEWIKTTGATGICSPIFNDTSIFDVEEVKQIQLDALKEGARRAAKRIETPPYGTNMQGNYISATEAILTAAEQWTEKDL